MNAAAFWLQIVSVRSGSSAILATFSILRMRHTDPKVRYFGAPSNRLKLLSRGLTGASAMTLYYFSIQLLPLGDAVTIFFTNVVRISALLRIVHDMLCWPDISTSSRSNCGAVCVHCSRLW
jgi:threonine/homoserine efflux transporter RhtA